MTVLRYLTLTAVDLAREFGCAAQCRHLRRWQRCARSAIENQRRATLHRTGFVRSVSKQQEYNTTTANELMPGTERRNVIDRCHDGLWTREWNLMAGQRQNIQVRMRQRLIQAMRILVRGHDLV